MHCPAGAMVNWQMRLTLRDSSLSGQNQARAVVGMSRQICQRHGKTAGSVLSCVPPSTHTLCERLSQTFIPPSHLLRLAGTKGFPDMSDKKKSEKTGSKKRCRRYEAAAAWQFLSNLCVKCRKSCQNKAVFLFLFCLDESSSLATVTQLQYFFLTLLYNFIGTPPGHNRQKKTLLPSYLEKKCDEHLPENSSWLNIIFIGLQY